MDECEAVVHLARGEVSVMVRGLENLLKSAVKQKISRFVHVSSVAVYGDVPPPESVSEAAPIRHCDNLYEREKWKQELRVRRCGRRHGLPAVILRPPNIWGPYSHFSVELVQKL
jgi:UDP-glucose 4-epimerase